MKRLMVITLITIAFIATLYFNLPHALGGETDHHKDKQLRIAIFTPTTHPALEEIEQGFKETLQELSSQLYLFTTFNANSNRTLLRGQAEEIINNNYDLICTIGAICSQTIAELIKKKSLKTPQVFCGVDSFEFAQSLKLLNESTTGVYLQVDYLKEIEVLHAYKPNAKNILLVYDPTHGTGLEKYKKEIETSVKKFGMRLHPIEIYQTNEIQQKVSALLPSMDVVLVLIDNTVVAGIDALILLCNRYGVTLFVSDLASGKKGAAIAYGITEYESGSSAARKAQKILIDKESPHELPIDAITQFSVAINKDTMKMQNLNIETKAEESYA